MMTTNSMTTYIMTGLGAFDEHDDIELLKAIKTKTEKIKDHHTKERKDRLVYDKSTIHPDIIDDEGMTSLGMMQGFLIGTLKQLVERLEAIETHLSITPPKKGKA